MEKASRVKQRTMTHKKRKGFMGNKGKNLTNVYNKSNVNIVNNELENTHTTSVNIQSVNIQSRQKLNSLSGYRLI